MSMPAIAVPERFASLEEERAFCKSLGVQVQPGNRPADYLAASAARTERRSNEVTDRLAAETGELRRELAEREHRERLDRAREQVRREDAAEAEAKERRLASEMAAAFPWMRP